MKGAQGKGKKSRAKSVASIILTLVWLLLMSFAYIAATEPPWLKKLSQLGRTDESRAYKDYGDNFLRQKNFRMAITQYQKAVKIKPDFVAALGNMAIAYNQSGNGDQAIKILQNALKLGTGRSGTIYFNMADIYAAQNKKEEAIEYYTKAIGSEIKQDIIYRKLGLLYFDLGQYERSREAFEKAVDIQTDPVTPYQDMLKMNLELYKNEPEHLAVIQGALADGISIDDLQNYDIETIRKVNESNPDIAQIHSYIGTIYKIQGNIAAARGHFEAALKINPDNVEARKNLQDLAQARQVSE